MPKVPTSVTIAAVVVDGAVDASGDFAGHAQLRKAAAAWGDGRALLIRVEPEDEAWRYSDVKHLFGHIYDPVIKHAETGYTKTELHMISKALWMPEGKTSLLQLSRAELREYSDLVEKWLREEFPSAFEEIDQRVRD